MDLGRRVLHILIIFLHFCVAHGQTGPGGFGDISGTSDLVLWLDAGTLSLSSGSNVTAWSDQSGYVNDASADTGFEPVFLTNQQNGLPVIRFDDANSDFLRVLDDPTISPTTTGVSIFAVARMNAATDAFGGIVSKVDDSPPGSGYFLARDNANNNARFLINGGANSAIVAASMGTMTIMSGHFDDANNQIVLYLNEGTPNTDTFTGSITDSGRDLLIGALEDNLTAFRFLNGDIAEVIVIDRDVNNAERIIIDNYLSSKFSISLTGNDLYSGDTGANGNNDFEVQGIGTEADGSQTSAQASSGLVLQQSSNFGNGDYVFAGHDNTALDGVINTSDIAGVVGLEGRWDRIWYIEITDSGPALTVNLAFDFSDGAVGGTPGPAGNYRLLYRAGLSGSWTDAGTATSVSGDQVIFSGETLNGNGYYTLGSVDLAGSPLPVEFESFESGIIERGVRLSWSTSTEINNAFFTVQRSGDGLKWNELAHIEGAGNSQERREYIFIDRDPLPNISYYRIRQTDFDGTFDYSNTLVQRYHADVISIGPNPTQNFIQLQNLHLVIWHHISLRSIEGKNVRYEVDRTNGVISWNGLAPGIYYLRLPQLNTEQAIYRIIIE